MAPTKKQHADFMKAWFEEPLAFGTGTQEKAYQKLKEDDGNCCALLVDMDLIAYRASAPCEGIHYRHPSLPDTFKYKKDIVFACEKSNLDVKQVAQHKDVEPEAFAIYNVDKMMERILDYFDDQDVFVQGFLTGKMNFRMELNPEYKQNRTGAQRPTHLNACKQHLMNRYGAKLEEGFEADDLIGIHAIKYRETDRDYVIISLDKDLDTIPGKHFNWVRNIQYDVTNDAAIRFFYEQCMMGDKTDAIPGIRGLGPKTAHKLLKDTNDPKEMYRIGLRQWAKYLFPKVENGACYTDEQRRKVVDTYRKSAELLWILREDGVMWAPPYDALKESQTEK